MEEGWKNGIKLTWSELIPVFLNNRFQFFWGSPAMSPGSPAAPAPPAGAATGTAATVAVHLLGGAMEQTLDQHLQVRFLQALRAEKKANNSPVFTREEKEAFAFGRVLFETHKSGLQSCWTTFHVHPVAFLLNRNRTNEGCSSTLV